MPDSTQVASDLMYSLLCEGASLKVQGESLVINTHGAELAPRLLESVRQSKPALMELLRKPQRNILDEIEKVARTTPEATALVQGETQVSYAGLVASTRYLADMLTDEEKVRPGCRVLVMLEPGVTHLITVLALFAAGATVVPVDLQQPRQRIALLIERSDPALVIYDEASESCLAGWTGELLHINELDFRPAVASTCEVPILSILHVQTAYLLHTSGSTGTPKGVLVGHEALHASMSSLVEALGFDGGIRMAASTSPGFDIAWLEWLGPLMAGGQVHFPSLASGVRREQRLQLFCRWLDDGVINCLQATPSMWKLLLMQGFSAQAETSILCGGEVMTAKLAGRLLRTGARVFNLYGPTEATVWATCQRVNETLLESGDVSIPIGKCLPHMSFAIDENNGNELLLAGRSLALGYFRSAELNAKKFLQAGVGNEPDNGMRFYRTGDRVRTLSDGSLVFEDRIDRQVKLNGFRIELAEIENGLLRHFSVSDVAVMVESVPGQPDTRRLVAHIVASKGSHNKTAEKLNAFLAQTLPSWMLPGRYAFHDALPLNANGKKDLKALAEMDRLEHLPSKELLDTEDQVRRCMQDLVQRDHIDRHDSFFDIGGSSILAASLLLMVNRVFAIDLPLSIILASPPTVAGLAALIDERKKPQTENAGLARQEGTCTVVETGAAHS